MNELLLSKNYGVAQFIKKGEIVNCLACKKEVYCRPSTIGRKKFCSMVCHFKLKKPKPKLGKWFGCFTCKKMVWVRPSNFFREKHFCSKNCTNTFDYGGKVERKCVLCDKAYTVEKAQIKHRGESKYCSRACHREIKHRSFVANKAVKNLKNSTLKKQLWLYFSKYIRQRDGGQCVSCGKKDDWRKTDAGHYIPKTAGLSLYFEEKNVHCQCTSCNRWMHGNLSKYALALQRKYGQSILEDLDSKRYQVRKIANNEYLELINLYKSKIIEAGYEFK